MRSPRARRFLLVLPILVLLPLGACSTVDRVPGAGAMAVGRGTVGTASFYGVEHRGERTASGERYDPNAMTAAHPSLPFGTRLRITNLGNGRAVVVRVNDRGPYAGGSIVDVSLAAARALGFVSAGSARVKIQRLG